MLYEAWTEFRSLFLSEKIQHLECSLCVVVLSFLLSLDQSIDEYISETCFETSIDAFRILKATQEAILEVHFDSTIPQTLHLYAFDWRLGFVFA